MIAAVGVVVPARNEAALLGRCLDSIDAAARLVARDGLEVVCAVVLDACADASRAVAERALATHDAPHRDRLWERRSRSSGRHCGASEHFCVIIRPPRIWVATTDADTVVPKSWLSEQVRYADQGADAVAGIVEVADWSEQPDRVRQRFAAAYTIDPDGSHGHVHGANLGLRASTYAVAGGMPALALAEDHALLDASIGVGAIVARTSTVRVTTSARRAGRAAGGFSDLLASLDR